MSKRQSELINGLKPIQAVPERSLLSGTHNTGGAKLDCSVRSWEFSQYWWGKTTAVYGPGNTHNNGGAKLYCSVRSWEFSQYWWGKTGLKYTVLGILTILVGQNCTAVHGPGNSPNGATIFTIVVMS